MRNFDALYADRHVAARGLPGPAAIAAQDGEFRGLLLNRADLADTPPAEKPPVKIVCCDVLRVPRTMVLELAGPGVEAAQSASKGVAGLLGHTSGPDICFFRYRLKRDMGYAEWALPEVLIRIGVCPGTPGLHSTDRSASEIHIAFLDRRARDVRAVVNAILARQWSVIYSSQVTEVRQTPVFRKRLDGLGDRRAVERIAQRIVRLQSGLIGDAKPVGGGVCELRIDYGPGYRVYFVQRGQVLIILLCGGSKRSQSRDTSRAKALAAELEDDGWPGLNRSTRRCI